MKRYACILLVVRCQLSVAADLLPSCFMLHALCSYSCFFYPLHLYMESNNYEHIGAWRSLVAHLLWEQGVGGSNPLAPTSLRQRLRLGRPVSIRNVVEKGGCCDQNSAIELFCVFLLKLGQFRLFRANFKRTGGSGVHSSRIFILILLVDR
jgi:hypothetical protein